MSWTQVSPTRWETPLRGMEDYFAFTGNAPATIGDNRYHYMITSKFKVDIDLPDVEAALKQAWIRLRFEHPQLAASTEDGKKVYETPDDTALQTWADSTLLVSSAANADELLSTAAPVKQITLYYVPRSSELVLRCHHHINDGIGSLQAMDLLFKWLTEPPTHLELAWGSEHIRLPAPLEESLGSPPTLTQQQTEQAAARLMAYLNQLPAIGPVCKAGKVAPGQPKTMEATFSPEFTAAIIKASKAQGITVTAAVHAAYALMLQRHADPESEQSRYTAITAHNMRRYLAQNRDRDHAAAAAVSLYYACQFISLPLPAPYSELAQALDAHYKASIDADVLRVHDAFTRTLAAAVRTPEYQNAPIPADATVSSLGILERYLQPEYGSAGTVRVRDFRMGCEIILGMTTLHCWTFRDQMHLVYSFNDAYEEPVHVRAYLDEMERILREELVGSRDT
ncbi:hypothetical protein BDW74DRAFT_175891 [Aspergillus multicolor]|uniref:uncharacterized protein n=1 Tax=Aspergillus multicolor TaxID=41759 RepID=UPI003CCDAA10